MKEEEMEELAREIADVLGIEAERIRVVLVTPTEVEVTIVGETLTAAEARASQLVELIRSGGDREWVDDAAASESDRRAHAERRPASKQRGRCGLWDTDDGVVGCRGCGGCWMWMWHCCMTPPADMQNKERERAAEQSSMASRPTLCFLWFQSNGCV